jgi:hypothetical protein
LAREKLFVIYNSRARGGHRARAPLIMSGVNRKKNKKHTQKSKEEEEEEKERETDIVGDSNNNNTDISVNNSNSSNNNNSNNNANTVVRGPRGLPRSRQMQLERRGIRYQGPVLREQPLPRSPLAESIEAVGRVPTEGHEAYYVSLVNEALDAYLADTGKTTTITTAKGLGKRSPRRITVQDLRMMYYTVLGGVSPALFGTDAIAAGITRFLGLVAEVLLEVAAPQAIPLVSSPPQLTQQQQRHQRQQERMLGFAESCTLLGACYVADSVSVIMYAKRSDRAVRILCVYALDLPSARSDMFTLHVLFLNRGLAVDYIGVSRVSDKVNTAISAALLPRGMGLLYGWCSGCSVPIKSALMAGKFAAVSPERLYDDSPYLATSRAESRTVLLCGGRWVVSAVSAIDDDLKSVCSALCAHRVAVATNTDYHAVRYASAPLYNRRGLPIKTIPLVKHVYLDAMRIWARPEELDLFFALAGLPIPAVVDDEEEEEEGEGGEGEGDNGTPPCRRFVRLREGEDTVDPHVATTGLLIHDLERGIFKRTCAVCGAVGILRRCGRCLSVRYCGVPCQAIDWKQGHVRECARMAAARIKQEEEEEEEEEEKEESGRVT